MTALPCRLQNDSPPNSIEQAHSNKENDSPKKPSIVIESHQRNSECNNNNSNSNGLIRTPKLPPDIESVIDESNYVNLNDITAKCKAISSDITRNGQKVTDAPINGMDKSNQNHINAIDNKSSKLNNFYLQINSTSTVTNGHNVTKPIKSIVNQKNLNNLSNSNLAKCSPSNINNNSSNSLTNGFTTNANHLNNNFNSSNSINSNGNCNGVLNDGSADTKSITSNGHDYNKNGLPAVSTAHMQYDVTNGQQMQANSKAESSNHVATPQTYVIHNGNGLLTSGNNGIKESPRTDCSKGEYIDFRFYSSELKFHCMAIINNYVGD